MGPVRRVRARRVALRQSPGVADKGGDGGAHQVEAKQVTAILGSST